MRRTLLLATTVLTACSLFVDTGNLSGQDGADGGSSVDGGGSADGADSPTRCPRGRGPQMALIEAAGASFCIDTTEVTRAQYVTFLDAAPATTGQPAECAWNTSYSSGVPNVDLTQRDHPMVKVDWCDAFAFCAWAGKRLCGALAGGGPLTIAEATDPTKSEWMFACTRNGSRAYPYGQAESTTTCNTDAPTGAAEAVGTRAACVGGFPGIFDMAGNVSEWENACDGRSPSGTFRCVDRGGSWQTNGRCAYASDDDATGTSSDWGFRCCATPSAQ
jgi:formylglycine-generating enzyme required for sulfatase activity